MHIRRAQLADLSQISSVTSRALWDDSFFQLVNKHQNQYPVAARHQVLRRNKRRFYKGTTMLVMVTDRDDSDWDEQEKVSACLALGRNVQDDQTTKLSWSSWLNLQLHWLEEQLIWYLHLDPSLSRAARIDVQTKMAANKPFKEYPNYYEVESLTVDPDYQRRGIGGRLLQEAQSIVAADKARVPLVLIASPKGDGLYRKNGFRKLGMWYFGGPAEVAAMVWEPSAIAKS